MARVRDPAMKKLYEARAHGKNPAARAARDKKYRDKVKNDPEKKKKAKELSKARVDRFRAKQKATASSSSSAATAATAAVTDAGPATPVVPQPDISGLRAPSIRPSRAKSTRPAPSPMSESEEDEVQETRVTVESRAGPSSSYITVQQFGRISGNRITTAPAPSRQFIQGQKQRKKHQQVNRDNINDLTEKIKVLEMENSNLQRDKLDMQGRFNGLEEENEVLADRLDTCDVWVKYTLQFMTKQGRNEFYSAARAARDSFPVGTNRRLRKTLGFNASKPGGIPTTEQTALKKEVIAFAAENSVEVPDKDKAARGIRYRKHYLSVLHQWFILSNRPVAYSTFCECMHCENPGLLFAGLKRGGHISGDVDINLMVREALSTDTDNDMEETFLTTMSVLQESDAKDKPVSYLEWANVTVRHADKKDRQEIKRINVTKKVGEAAGLMLDSYYAMKEHLLRDIKMKEYIKGVRNSVLESDTEAYCHVDWAENYNLKTCGEIQSAFFSNTQVSLHTGMAYSKEETFGFASLSDSSDHKAEAVHSALNPILEYFAARGIQKLWIGSDSPVSQYRNSKNVFLLKLAAQRLRMDLEWLYTESGHGKSACDGIGGVLKTSVDNLTAFQTDNVIHNAQDVLDILEGHTSIKLYQHTEEDIFRVRATIPGKLSSLSGAFKLHRITITKEGNLTCRQMPSDPPKPFRIRVVTRAPAAAVVSDTVEMQPEPMGPEQ